jgi:sugar/nucleoside kinase (ribokinase family)
VVPGVTRYDVAVLGDVNPDIVVRGAAAPRFGQAETLVEAITLTVGGSASIFACAAARLGLRTAMLGIVGDDALGAFMREALAARGVDVAHLRTHPDVPTGASAILARPDGDRAILTAAGTIAALGPEHVDPAVLATSRHVHVASAFLLDGLRPALPGLLRAARAAGATTSLDTNPDPRERYEGLDEALAETDVLLPNATEASGLAGVADVDAALDVLAARVPVVAVKLGESGARGRAGAEEASAGALAGIPFVDPVGAGDCFDAGFLAARLAGRPLAECLRLAVACGTLSTRAAGGVDGQPDLAEALAAAGL